MSARPAAPDPKRPMRRDSRGAAANVRRRCRWLTTFLAWSYLSIVGALVALFWMSSDRWWLATLLTFGPRWVVFVPLLPLVLLSILFCRRALALLALAAIVGAFPLMGFCLPWRPLFYGARRADAPMLRVVTCNCGGPRRDARKLADFILRTAPDLVILNEWGNSALPRELTEGWHSAQHSATVLSRFPILSVKKLGAERLKKSWRAPGLRCEIETPWGIVSVVGLHLDTPREGLSEVEWRRFWRAAEAIDVTNEERVLESEQASELAAEAKGPTIIAGDFNMPVDSAIYRRYWSQWQNAFSTAGFGLGYTKYTSRWGIRIDHVLANGDWRVLDARVGPDLGGDHRPVVAILETR